MNRVAEKWCYRETRQRQLCGVNDVSRDLVDGVCVP